MKVLLKKNTLVFDGNFVIDNSKELKDKLIDIYKKLTKKKSINIDLNGVNEIDSSAIQLIISLCKTLEKDKKDFKFVKLNENIANLFTLTGLNKFFRIGWGEKCRKTY